MVRSLRQVSESVIVELLRVVNQKFDTDPPDLDATFCLTDATFFGSLALIYV